MSRLLPTPALRYPFVVATVALTFACATASADAAGAETSVASTVEQATAAPAAAVRATVEPVRQAAAEPVRQVTEPIRQRATEVAAPVTTPVRETVAEATAGTPVTAQPATPRTPATAGGPARGHTKPAGRAAVKVGTATSRRVARSEPSAPLASDRRAALAAETFGDATRPLAQGSATSPAPTSRSGKPVADQVPPAAVSSAAPALLVEAVAGSGAASSASGGSGSGPAPSILTTMLVALALGGLVLTLISPSTSYRSAFLLAPIERPG